MIETLFTGIILFLLTSIIIYFYKAKQLYLVTTQLYNKSFLSDRGTITEVIIYNRGNAVENNVTINILSELNLDLIATSDESIKKNHNNEFVISKLHAKSDISLLFLVENGSLTNREVLSFTSDMIVGKKCSEKDSVPLNYGNIATFIVGFIILIMLTVNIPRVIEQYMKYQYSSLYKLGWRGLDSYIASDLSKSYTSLEFPIRFINQEIEENLTIMNFEIINKSAIPIGITMSNDEELEKQKNNLHNKYIHRRLTGFYIKEVAPMSKSELKFSTINNKKITINTSISHGNEYISGIQNSFILEK